MPEVGYKLNQVEFFGDPHTSLMTKKQAEFFSFLYSASGTDRGHNIISVGGQSIDFSEN